MSAYEKLAGLIVERDAVPIVGRIEQPAGPAYTTRLVVTPELGGLGDRLAELETALRAIQDGYPGRIANGLLIIENPNFRPDDGSNPNLVIDAALSLRTTAPALPVDAGEGRVLDGIERRLSGLQAAVSLCLDDENLTDLATIKRAWFYSKTGFDEAVGSLPWRELYARVAAAPQPPGVSLAPDALAVDKATKEAMLDAGYAVIQREPRLLNSGFLLGHVAQIYDAMQAVLDRAAIAQAETGKAGASEGRFSDEFSSGYRKVCADSAPSPEPSRQGVEAMRDVAAERERQKTIEGWTPEHDDTHSHGELARAAACYGAGYEIWFGTPGHGMTRGSRVLLGPSRVWPFDHEWWKPTTPRRNLIKAGALILAEIERLDRAEQRSQDVGGCTAGVGCDEYGCCYADAHGEPEKCPRTATLAQHQGAGQTSGGE